MITRITAWLVLALFSAATPAQSAPAESPLTLNTATGALQGSLLLPAAPTAAAARLPVVLIVAGSGPTDRDGNSAALPGPNHSLKLLAQGLAQGGWASVRYDKRGVAASAPAGPSEADLRFDTYVQDAAAWLRLLRADARFGPVVVLGHSEGSLIAMLAAGQVAVDGLVSLAGPAAGASTVLRTQLAGKLPPPLAARNEAVLASLERGETVADAPPELAALYRPSVQPYLISWFRHEPQKVLATLTPTLPVLVLQGSTDIQVGVADAQALQAARAGVELGVIDGMNHVLKTVPADLPSQLASYSNPALPLAEALMPRLLRFLAPLAPMTPVAPR